MEGDYTPHWTCTSRRVSEKRGSALPAFGIFSRPLKEVWTRNQAGELPAGTACRLRLR